MSFSSAGLHARQISATRGRSARRRGLKVGHERDPGGSVERTLGKRRVLRLRWIKQARCARVSVGQRGALRFVNPPWAAAFRLNAMSQFAWGVLAVTCLGVLWLAFRLFIAYVTRD